MNTNIVSSLVAILSQRSLPIKIASTNAPSSVSRQRKPLGDFELFKKSSSGILIWHFGQRAWQVWDPVNMEKDVARDLFWQGVKPILRVLHFANHAFLPADVSKYADDEYVDEVFTRDEWAKKLREHQALFNCEILTKVVQGKIIPRWQEKQGYPVRKLPQLGELEGNKKEARRARKDFFKQQARQDEEAFRTFTQYWPLIDWEVIRKQQTPDDTVVCEWTVNCLASVTNIVFKYGLDNPKKVWPSTLREGATQKEQTKKRNKYWLDLTEKYSSPPFQSILVESKFWELESDDRNNVSQAVLDQPDDDSESPVAKRPRIPSRQLQNDAAKPKQRPRFSAAIVRHVSNASLLLDHSSIAFRTFSLIMLLVFTDDGAHYSRSNQEIYSLIPVDLPSSYYPIQVSMILMDNRHIHRTSFPKHPPYKPTTFHLQHQTVQHPFLSISYPPIMSVHLRTLRVVTPAPMFHLKIPLLPPRK